MSTSKIGVSAEMDRFYLAEALEQLTDLSATSRCELMHLYFDTTEMFTPSIVLHVLASYCPKLTLKQAVNFLIDLGW